MSALSESRSSRREFLLGRDDINAVKIPHHGLPVPEWCAEIRRYLDGNIAVGHRAAGMVKEWRSAHFDSPEGAP
jgi:hypothetical protein